MDFQYWLYIIIGVIYLINQFRKKPEQQQTDFPEFKPERPQGKFEQPQVKPTAQKTLTFEELLREITEGKTQEQPKPTEPTAEYVDYDDNIEEEIQDLEDVDYDYKKKDKVYDIYDAAKQQAFNRPSLEETLRLSDTDMKFGRFKAFDQEQQRDLVGEYLADLKDPDGFKKAFVMSEILNRRF